MTPKAVLALLNQQEIEDLLTECCFFLGPSRIAKALARGCTEDELRVVTREVWLTQEDDE